MEPATIGLVAYCLVGTAVMALFVRASTRRQIPEHDQPQPPALNKYAHLLGRTVEAKVYEASSWERMVIVAVSWQGAVCVRPVRDMRTKGRWIRKNLVPSRIRELSD